MKSECDEKIEKGETNVIVAGRESECKALRKCEASGKSELVAVYGRYRIGKTFLVERYFNRNFTYSVTGEHNGKMQDQLGAFRNSLINYFPKKSIAGLDIPTDWYQAFSLLIDCLKNENNPGRRVILIDEASWLDTPKSSFLPALEHFWNSYASREKNIMLIIVSSAGTWIQKKLLDAYAGLRDKVTQTIEVRRLNLSECAGFYRAGGFLFDRKEIIEAYMLTGGAPYYMDAMVGELGLNQNIDRLFFGKLPVLGDEFDLLYRSFFRFSDNHINVAEVLTKNTSGLTRPELASAGGISEGGGLTKILSDMESCGLIKCEQNIGKKKKGSDIYKLTDAFTYFYCEFIKDNLGDDPEYWTNFTRDRERVSHPIHRFTAFAFERICAEHIPQIKQSLGISGIESDIYTFRSGNDVQNSQSESTWSGYKQKTKSTKNSSTEHNDAPVTIPIVIDRSDNVINLCHCKYSAGPYMLTERDISAILLKEEKFIRETGTTKDIRNIIITANDFSYNAGRTGIAAEIMSDDLFAKC